MKNEAMNKVTQERKKKYSATLSRCRLLYVPDEAHNAQISDVKQSVDLNVLAPVINAFVIWLLKSAVSSGVETLYFLARDGYLMYLTAKEYCERFHLPVSCRYFYCSRYSLRIPMYHKNHSEALNHICRGGIDVSLHKIMVRSGFDEKTIQVLYPLFSDRYGLYEVIPYASLGQIRADLAGCAEYLDMLDQVSVSAWPGLCGYFEQEGLLAHKKIAIADSGWTGTTQKTINDILRACGRTDPIEGYYFGLYELPPQCQASEYHSFYFSPGTGLGRKVFFSNCLFETVFSAPHGTTLGYDHRENGYAPRSQIVNDAYSSYFKRLREDVLYYTRMMTAGLEWDRISDADIQKMTSVISKVLLRFMWEPSHSEAEEFGSLPFSDDLQDTNQRELAVRLTEKQMTENHVVHKIMIMLGIQKTIIHESAWFEGSAIRYSHHHRWHRINYALYKMLVYLKKML